MSVAFVLIGLLVMIIAGIALVRGRLRWLAISTRKIATGVLVGGFALLIAGIATNPQPSTRTSALAVPAPAETTSAVVTPTTTTVAPVPTTMVTTTVLPVATPVATTRPPTVAAPHTVHTAPVPVVPQNCTASVSDPHPSHNQTTDIIVRTGIPGASVTATANYKTTVHPKNGHATASGTADIPFDISTATYDYPVTVDVTVAGSSETCSTEFVPEP